MTYMEQRVYHTGHAGHVCNVCGRPSENTICDQCSIKIRAEALIRKRHKDKGEE
jgi:hypothetical protein